MLCKCARKMHENKKTIEKVMKNDRRKMIGKMKMIGNSIRMIAKVMKMIGKLTK